MGEFPGSLAILPLLMPLVGHDDIGSVSLRNRLFREAPEAWRRLRESEEHVVGTLHLKTWAYDHGEINKNWGSNKYYEFRRNGDLLSLSIRAEGNPGTMVLAAGPRYAFKLSRKGSEEPYVLRSLNSGPPERTVEDIYKSTFFKSSIISPRTCWGIPLEEMIRDPGFVLKDVAAEHEEGGDEVVRLDFEYSSDDRNLHITDAWLTVKPSRDWAVQRAEFKLRDDWIVSILNEYSERPGGVVAPRSINVEYRFTEDHIEEYQKIEAHDGFQGGGPEWAASRYNRPDPSGSPSDRPTPPSGTRGVDRW